MIGHYHHQAIAGIATFTSKYSIGGGVVGAGSPGAASARWGIRTGTAGGIGHIKTVSKRLKNHKWKGTCFMGLKGNMVEVLLETRGESSRKVDVFNGNDVISLQKTEINIKALTVKDGKFFALLEMPKSFADEKGIL